MISAAEALKLTESSNFEAVTKQVSNLIEEAARAGKNYLKMDVDDLDKTLNTVLNGLIFHGYHVSHHANVQHMCTSYIINWSGANAS